ncbi:nascent polypeptide-associated complex protein [Candidatus Woesearchaeota archaeon]|nr:nascent polypeptide-associated complex protein [Candidatus Woesearchaeota archaeon]
MLPGMNPKKMQQMMQKMGIKQIDIPATEVIIKTGDKELVITEPKVSKVNMMGQETFQVVGNVHERESVSELVVSDDDIQTVADQAGVSIDKAKEAIIAANGDLAEAILNLQS